MRALLLIGMGCVALVGCATLSGPSPSKALLTAEAAFNVAANGELEMCPSGATKTPQCAKADILRHEAYAALLAARATYKTGRTPNTASILALTAQLTALLPHKAL